MPIVLTEETPFSDMTIKGLTFSAPWPFKAGDTLDERSAPVLCQTYQENLRNNFASTVEEEIEAAEKAGREVDKAKLDAAFKEYYTQYDFGLRRSGARVLDPLQAAIRDLGRPIIREALRKNGAKVSDISTSEIDELLEAAVAKPENAWIIEMAKERVESEKKLRERATNLL